jgi:hypothetical protein
VVGFVDICGVRKFDENKFGSKQLQKRMEGKCRICGESDYKVLDMHRIEEGARYSFWNTVTLCCRCHRRQQAGEIRIVEWVDSTMGRLLHWFDSDGVEKFS